MPCLVSLADWPRERAGSKSIARRCLNCVKATVSAGRETIWRWGLVNSQTAEVVAVKGGAATFRLEDGRVLQLHKSDAQVRHIDRAWASTVHAFQGRTVDTVIAAMEANHPHLTTQKTLYVEISRARRRAELVTDDRDRLRERLEGATGERIAALESVEPGPEKRPDSGREAEPEQQRIDGPVVEEVPVPEMGAVKEREAPKFEL